jgi:YD repeat-containing protein
VRNGQVLNGCSILTFDPNNPSPICFDSLFDPQTLQYAPTTYVYTDPYGTVYTMGSDGTLKSIQDRNQNILTFAPDGITSSVNGQTVTLTRDDQGRITKVLMSLGAFLNGQIEYDYAYDASGNLAGIRSSARERPCSAIDGFVTCGSRRNRISRCGGDDVHRGRSRGRGIPAARIPQVALHMGFARAIAEP